MADHKQHTVEDHSKHSQSHSENHAQHEMMEHSMHNMEPHNAHQGHVMSKEDHAAHATVPSGAARNGISFSRQPAVPASSGLVQLDIPETDMIDMSEMTP
jgi:hypothetical protein